MAERRTVAWGAAIVSLAITVATNADRIAKFLGIVNIPKDAHDLMVSLSQVPAIASWIIVVIGLAALAYIYTEQLAAVTDRGRRIARSWELRSPIARKGYTAAVSQRPRPPQVATPAPIASQSPLTDEQRHFRLELRKFVTRLATAYRKLRDAQAAVAELGPSKQAIISLAISGAGWLRPTIKELEQLAQVDIVLMDQDRLQRAILEFLRHTYGGTQTIVSRLSEALRQAGIQIDPSAPRLSRKLREWLDADEECLRLFRDLTTSPEAALLKSAPLKFFGTVDQNRWGAGLQ